MEYVASFQEAVWLVVSQIPEGKVATYGQVASMAAFPRKARHVGRALAVLPDDSTLPWHRVVNRLGKLSFPPDSRMYRLQQQRLISEGIEFIADKIPLSRFLWNNP
ncbi:MAG: MGMT family protein [Hahellaceae bacterium]|nr:MGMT family protein [Hahellaceae bacterium]